MNDGVLEPLGRRDDAIGLPFSLRGSLASTFVQLKLSEDEGEATRFINGLLTCGDPDIVIGAHDGQIVIGRLSERGCYYPDW